jgi:hypothetical protein
MKANIFQKRSARFKVTIDLNKEVHTNNVPSYVKNVNLISLRQRYRYKEYEEKPIKTDGHELLLDALKFTGISGHDRI